MSSDILQRSRGALAALDEIGRGSLAPRLDRLRLADLEPDPDNHRQDVGHMPTHSAQSQQAFQELVESIRSDGLTDPIKVLPPEPPSDKYRIRDGHRRYFAALHLGLSQVDVIVRQRSLPEIRVEQLISNLLQERPNPVEIAVAIQHAIDAGMSADGVATAVGKGKSWVSNYRAILRYPPAIQEALRDGRLRNVNTARELASLPPEQLDAALQGVAVHEDVPRARATSGPTTDEEGEGKRSKRAKPIPLAPARAERLLQLLAELQPDLVRSAGWDPSEPLPDRSRRAVAFRKLVEAVFDQLEPKANA
jgi:ParB/RepB/Spo0J family partition protein